MVHDWSFSRFMQAKARLFAGLLSVSMSVWSVGGSRGVKEAHRIHGGGALADFEMDLRAGYRTGLAGLGDDVAALDRVAALDEQVSIVGVGGNPAAFMANEDQIAITFELVSGIGDDASLCRAYIGALGNRNVDAFVTQA